MKVIVTADEFINYGNWDAFCFRRGLEGSVSSDKEFVLSIDEIVEYELRPRLRKLIEMQIPQQKG